MSARTTFWTALSALNAAAFIIQGANHTPWQVMVFTGLWLALCTFVAVASHLSDGEDAKGN